ncbi:MAG TPA: hypothetical protein VG929_06790 [Actinomycetota bacterium]|nr:hypothetical protein [Actinomycetota bacterium]
MEQLLAGPVDLGPGFALYLLLVIIVIPGLAIAGAVLLVIALARHLRHRNGETLDDPKAQRRTRRFAIAGGLMCLPMAILVGNQVLSYRQAVESQEKYLTQLEFDIYEPTVVPPGYRVQGDVNTFRDPPYIDYYMADGVHVTQFEYTPDVEPFLNPDEACDPEEALSYLILNGGELEPTASPTAAACRPLMTTPGGRVLYGTGEPSPSRNEVVFTLLGDTVVVFEFSFMYQGDKTEIPALVDSLRPVPAESLNRQ